MPRKLPTTFATAMGTKNLHHTFPVQPNQARAAMLVVMLITFALATACRKSNPSALTNRKIRKVPVPGPKKPSYNPSAKAIAEAIAASAAPVCAGA